MNFFNVLAELVDTVQRLNDKGWKFKFEPGDYQTSRLWAIKGEKKLYCYESDTVECFLQLILNEELREWNEKLMDWFKTGSVCPNCKIKPPINTYKCQVCGWEL